MEREKKKKMPEIDNEAKTENWLSYPTKTILSNNNIIKLLD